MPVMTNKENEMPTQLEVLTRALTEEVAEHGPDGFMAQQLRRQIGSLKFQESKAGTKQQEEIFGACFNPCDNSE